MVAHHPWVITPDGRDPRALQGNFTDRRTRPDLEADIRAIPGSHRFVATAAPHHGQSFGSLVVFDPRVPDDDQMSAVKRVTPDVGFPESQGGSTAYGEAWPLSEDYYLCVVRSRPPKCRNWVRRGNHGIYLVDSFGNKELIYRDPDIGCHSPMPLAPRPKPPVVTEPAERFVAGPAGRSHGRRGERLSQPAAVARGDEDRGPARLPGAAAVGRLGRDGRTTRACRSRARIRSTSPARCSARCRSSRTAVRTSPCRRGKELFFQALDEQGLAVTSMRSGTQFQPGETATCQGCHEPRHGTVARRRPGPRWRCAAPRRGRKPDVDGTNPFSYPRLVQPVLDKHCVACHQKEADKAAPLGRQPGVAAQRGLHGSADDVLRVVSEPGAEVRLLRLR